ncbi:MAG: hypothetical protein DI598_19780 [Pseudopedobacter saltans]|uniref:6-bladed beta-propeller n=1 Tax=Pseudopedobacter saltans TaxID=151895 RepID=A0A2W5GC07_9SPHI|nr:MAG: hypothetical protein DI598_19780 [Pseudopedobacter saltans]
MRINPDDAMGGTVSQLFGSVRYVPLETTADCLFGGVTHLQVSTNFYAFYDMDTKHIYVFGRDGKFRYKIGQLYINMDLNFFSSFWLDPKNEHIRIPHSRQFSDQNNFTYQTAEYDTTGRLIYDQDLSNRFSQSYLVLGNGDYILPSESDIKDSIRFVHIAKNGMEQNVDFYYSHTPNPYVWQCVSGGNADGVLWSRRIDYTLQKMDRKGTSSQFRLVFPQSLMLDIDFYKDTVMLKDRQRIDRYFSSHSEKITSLGVPSQSGDYMLFSCIKGNDYIGSEYLYSLTSEKLYSLEQISPDSANSFLPIVSYPNQVSAFDNSTIFTVVPSFLMFTAMEANKQRNPTYPKILQTYFLQNNRKSNPVIVELKLKSSL